MADITEEKLANELKNRGYEMTFIRQFVKKGKKLPLHMVILQFPHKTRPY